MSLCASLVQSAARLRGGGCGISKHEGPAAGPQAEHKVNVIAKTEERAITLRQLREGGFPWKELVIFLRATHAQLVDAGYEGLDAKDMLFKQYRPE